jgi:phosphate starvation-inducible protein PhoH and related proteins
MSSKSRATINDLVIHEPITENQVKAYEAWDNGDNLVLAGSAGTGKTFVAMYLALEAMLEKGTPYDKIMIFRSIVPTRDIGYLPGSLDEKKAPYEITYQGMCTQLIGDSAGYNRLISSKQIEFHTTSFIRGMTIDNAIIVVDEMQNLNFHELDSVITRVGENCRIVFSGDYNQSDFKDGFEKEGIQKFLRIVEHLKNFTIVQFGWHDIVRSDFLRDYIMAKEFLGYR